MDWTFKGIGTAGVDNKKVTCDFSMSSDEFFARFEALASGLSADTHDTIARAIDKKSSEKIKKKDDEFVSFFNKIEASLKGAPAAAAETVEEEGEPEEAAAEAEKPKAKKAAATPARTGEAK